jgi:exopolysaccharide biosynthesis predicted pyruvyltransferase EpsI
MNAVSEKVDPALKRLAVIMDARFDGITARDKEKYDFNKIKAEEIKGVLNRTSCVITDRMHLCILAYISGVPRIFVFGRDGDKLKYIAELLKIPLLKSGFDDISVFPLVIHKKIEVKKLA